MRVTSSGTNPVRNPRPVSSFPDLLHPWAVVDEKTRKRRRAKRPTAAIAVRRRVPAPKREAA